MAYAFGIGCMVHLFFMLQPTRADRGWFVNPMKNPVWTIFAGILPALLATILIFMDQQITAVIVNRKEHKLKVRIKCLFFNEVPTELKL